MRKRKKSKRPREGDLNFLVKSEDYTVQRSFSFLSTLRRLKKHGDSNCRELIWKQTWKEVQEN